jgi:predicted acylesterase/phospholipase RssA
MLRRWTNCLRAGRTSLMFSTGTVWRYVRASMTYAFYLPPVCDPCDGHLLVGERFVETRPIDIREDKQNESRVCSLVLFRWLLYKQSSR